MGTAIEDHTRDGGPHSWRLYLRHQLQGAETPSAETVALHSWQGWPGRGRWGKAGRAGRAEPEWHRRAGPSAG